MKRKIKNAVKFLLIMVITATGTPIIANAQTLNDTLYMDTSYTYDVATTKYDDPSSWVIGHENPIRRQSDGSYVYCVQAHVHFENNSSVIGHDTLSDKMILTQLSEDELEQIELTAYYGYGYGNHTDLDWYAATQLLIWEVTDKTNTPYPVENGDTTLTRSSKYDAKMNEIRNLVAHHGKTISFNYTELTLNVGETTKLTDTNEVLSSYFDVESNDYVDLSIQGNDLVITAKKPFEGDIDLKAKTNNNIPMIYEGSTQKCLSRGDPTYLSGAITINITTEFKIKKVYGSTNSGVYRPEENAKFELYDDDSNELITTFTTNEDGEDLYYLRFGNYRLHQVSGIEGYKMNSDYKFTINGAHTKEIAYLTNEKIKSDLLFKKTDVSTDVGLPNTLVEIYNAETEELIFSGRTDGDGQIIIKNIEYGNYYILEKEAPEGYELNPEKMYFSVTEDGQVIKVNMKDNKIEEKPKEEIIEVPDTLVYEHHELEVITSIILAIGLGLILYGIKTKKNKK